MNVWRDAVLEEGRLALYEVTTRLYQGGSSRPDVFLGQQRYMKTFNTSQRHIIETSGSWFFYNINTAAQNFDVSLHFLMIEHTCGLGPCANYDNLYMLSKKLKECRDKAVHDVEIISDGEPSERLDELCVLCFGILEELEYRLHINLASTKEMIKSNINQRKNPDSNEKSFLTTVGNIALGVGVGAAGLAIASNTKERERRDQQRNVCIFASGGGIFVVLVTGNIALGVVAAVAGFAVVYSLFSDRKGRELRDTMDNVSMFAAGVGLLAVGVDAVISSNRNQRKPETRQQTPSNAVGLL